MIRKSLFSTTLILGLIVIGGIYIKLTYFGEPRFIITNTTLTPVSVVAKWRDKTLNLNRIGPSETHEFSISDEAAMSFLAHFNDGNKLTSKPIYFTGGSVITVTIDHAAIEVNYDFNSAE